MRKPLLPLTLFALVLGVTASAYPQVAPPPRAVQPVPAGDPKDGPQPPPGAVAKEGGKDGAADAAPTESPRMTRLKQLTFDRRASAVLKAWAPKPKTDKIAPARDPKVEALDKEIA